MSKTKIYDGLELLNIDYFSNGNINSGFPKQEYKFETEYGTFTAQYDNAEARRRTYNSLEFFEDGSLRRISLQDREYINTSIGKIPAELVIFYESGKLKKIFPLNGRVTGFWSEKDEFGLAEDLEFSVSGIHFKNKFINLEFHENGNLKSALLWPGQLPVIDVKGKKVKIKSGFSFYENGNIKSFEPAESIVLPTPIGDINILNSTGSNGMVNSHTVTLDSNGDIQGVKTTTDKFEVLKNNEIIGKIEPELRPSMCNDSILIPMPIEIKFHKDFVKFGKDEKYDLNLYQFKTYNKVVTTKNIGCCS